jgi:hypothetical protein
MKQFMLLVGVAAVAGAMYVAGASGSQQASGPSLAQFKALKKQVASEGKTLNSVKKLAVAEGALLVACDAHAVAIGQFGNPAAGEGYHYLLPSNNPPEILTTSLDAANPADPNASFFAYGGPTCNTALGGLRHAAPRAGVSLPRASHPGLFIAHQR